MSRRIPGALAALALLGALVSPVSAQSKVVAQRTSLKGQPGVYLSHGLLPGDRVEVEVTATRARGARSYGKVQGLGAEFYTYVTKKGLFTGSKSVKFVGTVPYHIVLAPPRSGLASWVLATNIAVLGSSSVRTRFIDLGKH